MQDFSEEKNNAANRKIPSTPNIKLRRERELKGWSQAYVAEKIEAQPRLVTRWETGQVFPSPYYRQKLCHLFDKNAEDLGLIKHSSSTTIEDAQSISAVPALVQNEVHAAPEATFADTTRESLSPQSFFSRRRVMLGLLGGGIAVAAGGFWLIEALTHSGAPSSSSLSKMTTLYTYKPYPPVYINYVEWSPGGKFIACAIGDRTVRVLDATNGDMNLVYQGHHGYVNGVSWEPHEIYVASAGGDKTVHVWKPLTGERLLTYHGHTGGVYCVSWSHDGKWLASSGEDTTIQIWEALTGKPVTTYRDHTQPVWNIAWSPDSRTIATGGDDGILRVWNPMTGKKSTTFVYQGPYGSKINEISWSPDGQYIATALKDATVRIWHARSGALIGTYTDHSAPVMTARWSVNGKYIASGGLDNAVYVWNPSTRKQILSYHQHTNEILEVSWAPDSKRLAIASKDYTMDVCQIDLYGTA